MVSYPSCSGDSISMGILLYFIGGLLFIACYRRYPHKPSKQATLCAGAPEAGGIELPAFGVHTVELTVFFVLLRYEFSNVAFATHAHAPAAVVYLPVVAGFDEVPDFVGAVGVVLVKPVVEEELDGPVEADKSIGSKYGAVIAGGFHDALHFVLV